MIPDNSLRDRVFEFAAEKYGTKPEYLWAKNPEYAVLRREDNEKWYAVFMNIPKEKIGIGGGGFIDVMNIKCSELMLGSLLLSDGFFPAYHMNKYSWISVSLDGTVDETTLFELLEISHVHAAGRDKGQ
jgi:predicted DNA-binding protein (MmcQ/YjbR family)